METLLFKVEKDLQDLRNVALARNTCSICWDIMRSPHMSVVDLVFCLQKCLIYLPCGHLFCPSCISGHARHCFIKRQNAECPACLELIGCFTPLHNLHAQTDVEDMQRDLGLGVSVSDELDWPEEFQTIRSRLPFARHS